MEYLIGALVSLFVQFTKSKVGASGWKAVAFTLGVSLLAAGGYTMLADGGYWAKLLPIFTTAGAVYTFLIVSLQKKA